VPPPVPQAASSSLLESNRGVPGKAKASGRQGVTSPATTASAQGEQGAPGQPAPTASISPEQYTAERPVRLDRCTATGRAALEGRAIHIPDVLADLEYDSQRVFNFRTALGVPLMRDGKTIGVFAS
jgi:GAF domain-containing protein